MIFINGLRFLEYQDNFATLFRNDSYWPNAQLTFKGYYGRTINEKIDIMTYIN